MLTSINKKHRLFIVAVVVLIIAIGTIIRYDSQGWLYGDKY